MKLVNFFSFFFSLMNFKHIYQLLLTARMFYGFIGIIFRHFIYFLSGGKTTVYIYIYIYNRVVVVFFGEKKVACGFFFFHPIVTCVQQGTEREKLRDPLYLQVIEKNAHKQAK